ncbi:hypothetical protein K7H91_18305 [Martelella mediterranea]|uniref:hypothetical protein n=1 Tax=Martelella mediterranea TaxID=293089 RepID=UPI001E2C57DF|nr:hypothetical protein [Martelella mediterranea]MCD1635724.1 hypothetical protein [Martelella mediterranea]
MYAALGAANPASAEGTRSCAARHPAAIAGHVPPRFRTAQKDCYHDHSRNSEAAERGIHVAFVIDAFEAGIERLSGGLAIHTTMFTLQDFSYERLGELSAFKIVTN